MTVNGCERLFNSICAEAPNHEPGIVIYDEEKKRASVAYKITYRLKNTTVKVTREITINIKLQYSKNGYLLTTDDAVLGKARRKILYSILRELKGIEIGEAEIERENTAPRNVTPSKTAESVAAGTFDVEGAK
jgi:hypothetical protein